MARIVMSHYEDFSEFKRVAFFCSECGERVTPLDRFCSQCGERFEGDENGLQAQG